MNSLIAHWLYKSEPQDNKTASYWTGGHLEWRHLPECLFAHGFKSQATNPSLLVQTHTHTLYFSWEAFIQWVFYLGKRRIYNYTVYGFSVAATPCFYKPPTPRLRNTLCCEQSRASAAVYPWGVAHYNGTSVRLCSPYGKRLVPFPGIRERW